MSLNIEIGIAELEAFRCRNGIPEGVSIEARHSPQQDFDDLAALLARYGIAQLTQLERSDGRLRLRGTDQLCNESIREFNTLDLHRALPPEADNQHALEREIVLALLISPVLVRFANIDDFHAMIRLRRDTVLNARATQMCFGTGPADRPAAYWRYQDGDGFCLQPGAPLIDAIRAATQPDSAERGFTFSCYRASEYVMLLALAMELQRSNPMLLDRLQKQWERSPIQSGRFHDVFLDELGSIEQPMPMTYYVPGDRVWFRNPDERSADVAGYEGSWVVYLGGGEFSNFWNRSQPYTLLSKCIEIYHWRDAVVPDSAGEPAIDESIVLARTATSMRDPWMIEHILGEMLKIRDAKGTYRDGGCIDASREFFKSVDPVTAQIRFPVH